MHISNTYALLVLDMFAQSSSQQTSVQLNPTSEFGRGTKFLGAELSLSQTKVGPEAGAVQRAKQTEKATAKTHRNANPTHY